MPKPVHELSPFVYAELRKHIRIKTGLMIQTKSECELLANQINDQTQNAISASTLYRIFISGKNTKPYINTLNGLSVFCGFKDWFDFENHVNELAKFDFSYGKLHNNEKLVDSFIKICIQNNQLDVLYQYIKQFPSDVDFDKKIRIGYEFYQSLLENPNSNIDFFDKFSELPIVRQSFFEIMADPDFKIKDYEYGLNAYLLHCKNLQKPNDFRDQIFAKSLLFRHYYVCGFFDKASHIGDDLYQNKILEHADLEKLSIFPKLRYLSYKLLYKKLKADDDAQFLYKQFLIDYCKKNIQNWNNFQQRVTFYNIADVFLITKTEKNLIENLKNIFSDLLADLPRFLRDKSLETMLFYFQENASVKLRNLKIS